ncbi:MAG: 4-oxalomesaconate tautomerase, partial [Gammaproteobacteria bacterium]
MQTRIPCALFRGGTSRGAYFLASDLPCDEALRDQILIAVMGSPDKLQIDGIGGSHPLTSKVAIIKPSEREGVDVDYLFVQVFVDEARTSTKQNCGNILAGVGPFAIEKGLVEAEDGETTVTVYMENTDSIARERIQTPGGQVNYQGEAAIDGVPGTHAPIMIEFLDVAGSSCGALFPTGNVVDEVEGVPVTMVDNGMPVVVMDAASLGLSGHESIEELENNAELKEKIEAIRLKVGPMMNLGDVADKTVPKMALVSKSKNGYMINTRSFIPHRVHESIGVFAAVSVATAAATEGSTAFKHATIPEGNPKLCHVEHPTGKFTVEVNVDEDAAQITFKSASVLRTARFLFDGQVMIPAKVWDG